MQRYAGRRVLVLGSGHSALNALLDLAQLAEQDATTQVTWAVRRTALGRAWAGHAAISSRSGASLGRECDGSWTRDGWSWSTGFRCDPSPRRRTDSSSAPGRGTWRRSTRSSPPPASGPTGRSSSEVRLDLDPAVQSPKALAPLIDPNVHSCGTVRPHGADELKHPDPNLFVIGMKSYGRAPTFLMLTGYEQARSVVSAIAGDWDAARRVELVLPETGVCSLDGAADPAAGGCCGSTEAVPVAVTIGRGPRAGTAATQPGCCS